ncbi:bactofilin family protein [Candidatus Methylacidithermus pantelleriae]|nr:polymer-forming cytoskeletal protein [Candidatus Methylacidithermus pantelleriae]
MKRKTEWMAAPATPSVPPEPPRGELPEVTVLNPGAEFKGVLGFRGELHLNGCLEGTIVSEEGTLTIGEEAMVKAEIRVRDVTIFGKLQGNVVAQNKVDLRGKAQMYGDVKAARLLIDEGAVFVGKAESLVGAEIPKPDFSQMFSLLRSDRKVS